MNDEKLEQPKETCGLMLVMEGGMTTTINLFATKEEVTNSIQNRLSSGIEGLCQFNTANPDEQEVCLFDPKKILLAMVKKEFLISTGKIIPASLASPGVKPSDFKH